MKGLTKTIVALALVITVLATMGMSAMAASYSTKTTYQAEDRISVTATATDLTPGEIVTYVAKSEAEVNEETIVYINQGESVDGEDVVFTYTTDVTDIDAIMLFGGSSVDTAQSATEDDADYYNITVVVNSDTTAAKTIKVPTQTTDAGDVIRKIDITELAVNGEITSVLFGEEKIEDFAASPTTLMLYTDKIGGDGTLYINSSEKTYEEIDCGSATLADGNIKAVAKVPASDEFGVVIYTGEAPEIEKNEVVAAEDKSYVILPALGKNASGIFAVELQGYTDFLKGDSFNVAAYALNGNDYVLSDARTVSAN